MHRFVQYIAVSALIGFGLFAIGCGPPGGYIKYPETGATLEGTVTYGSEKVNVAMIIAQGEKGSATGFVDDNGHYKLENVPLGEVNLGVNVDAGKGQMMGKMMAQSQGKAKGNQLKVIKVPAKYGEPTKSGIKTTVKKGPNTYDIVIPK